MFVPRQRRSYDWDAIRSFYELGHSAAECQARFGISNGAWHGAVQRGAIVARDMRRRPRTETRQAVASLLAQGLSQATIARELGIAKPTVCFHMRRLGIAAAEAPAQRYDWEAIRRYYEAGHSATDCRKRFGFGRDAWAAAIARGVIRSRPKLEPLDAVLATGRRRSRAHVKARLFAAGVKDQRCEGCGLTEWLDAPISLELHHINGDGHDNRLENLRLLCPNCHSQTDTWGGRNKRRKVA
ncbi:MAG TPA: LuxR C-terminal-related transcriptional regulator [Solirubrobacteraceae bacterium]|nr:LuxR C-terminal-related transcriptional regulator [Solirubrobacteraceae bacterium]